MVLLMCAPPDENLRPNLSNAREAGGKLTEERPLGMTTFVFLFRRPSTDPIGHHHDDGALAWRPILARRKIKVERATEIALVATSVSSLEAPVYAHPSLLHCSAGRNR